MDTAKEVGHIEALMEKETGRRVKSDEVIAILRQLSAAQMSSECSPS